MQLDGYAQPYSMTSNEYNDFTTYNISIYSGGELFLRRLQYVVGDSTMKADPPQLLRPVEAEAT